MKGVAKKRLLGPLVVGVAIGAVYWLLESERRWLVTGGASLRDALAPSASADMFSRLFVLAVIGLACVAAVYVSGYLAIADEARERAETAARDRDKIRYYLDTAGTLMLALDPQGCITMANSALCEFLGVEESELLGQNWFAEYEPLEERDGARAHYHEVMKARQIPRPVTETRVRRRQGPLRLVRWTSRLLREPDGTIGGMLCSGLDVTDERSKADELTLKSFVLDNAIDSIVVYRLDGTILYANDRACEDRGLTKEQFLALPPFGWMAPELRDEALDISFRIARDGVTVLESATLTADGRRIPCEVHAQTVEVEGEEFVVWTGRDISERKQAEETIARMAFYDPLTGLANRSLFMDRLRIALAQSARSARPLAVIFLDLDHFKNVNDTLGHNVGDRMLQAVAGRLSGAIREGDTLARLGGDEFTFVLPDIESDENAARVAGKLLELFQEPFAIEKGIHMTASMGVAVIRGTEATVEDAIGRADAAMYRAKEESRNCFRFYEEAMRATANERFSLKSRLHAALHNNEFVVYYQPQVRAETERLIGVEALVRWQHPERGLLYPGAFLELVEEANLMDQLGEYVMRTACSQAAEWLQHGLGALKMAVNATPTQFLRPEFAALVGEVLESSGLPSELLELEVTESAAFAEPDLLEETLSSLRQLGVRIAIDDFGTGFNSLDRLRRLHVDAIKIDRSFVAEVETHPDAAAIANTVVVLAHHLGLAVVGEGVETPSQAEFLRARGCDVLQGFLYSPAVSAGQIADMLESGQLAGSQEHRAAAAS